MTDDERIPNYFTTAVHRGCGGLVRAMIQVTGEKRRLGFMCAKCHAMWDAPDGVDLAVPPSWVEKERV